MSADAEIFSANLIASLDGTEPEAFAVLGERIIATGSTAELRSRFSSAQLTHLDGALVVPGFNDAHCHPSWAAALRLHCDVSPAAVEDADGVHRVLSERAGSQPPGSWVFGSGYVEPRDGQARIDRDLLDRVSDDHPVAVVLSWLHAAVVNSRALELAGFTDDSDDPIGGELGRTEAGQLDGWLHEQAWLGPYWGRPGRRPWAAFDDTDTAVGALVAENDHLHSFGITSYGDAIVTPDSWRLYQIARARGRLTARVGLMLWHTYTDTAIELGIASRFGDDQLRYLGVKSMYDGAISGGTCLASEPYPSATGTDNGLQLVDADEFQQLMRTVHSAASRTIVHANGDRAISAVLDAIESVQEHDPAGAGGHRIEHCSMADRELIGRLAAAGVVAVPFGGFIHVHGDRLIEFYGRERAERLLAHRSLLDAGVTVGGSSDYPAGPASPLLAIQSMVTRTTETGQLLGEAERLSPRQALEVYTVGSARSTGEADIKGRLTPGHLADFAVLDRDILSVDPFTIADTSVLSTWVGGKCVWSAS